MRKLGLLCALLLPLMGWAQSFVGHWGGEITLPNTTLKIIYHIAKQGELYTATMDIPQQGAWGIGVDLVTVKDGELNLDLRSINAMYRGKRVTDKRIDGYFTQYGTSFPLVLTPAEIEPVKRPQTPQPPFPYTEREVRFESRAAGVTLNGTLTLPTHTPRAAVILVTGSGLQNRNEELFSHQPFAVIADYLTRHDIAVLRYDDRGWDWNEEQRAKLVDCTTDDYTEDALGALDFLAAELPHINIGILGHSEGGTIAFLAAARDKRVGFIVSLAGSMLRGNEVMMDQTRTSLEGSGLPGDMVEKLMVAFGKVYTLAGEHPLDDLRAHAEEYRATLKNDPLLASFPQTLVDVVTRSYQTILNSGWLHHFVNSDPADAIRKSAHRPILALNGAMDIQVRGGKHLGRLKQLLPRSKHLATKIYPATNHLFQPCTSGAVAEYATIETTISEEVLADIASWIEELPE